MNILNFINEIEESVVMVDKGSLKLDTVLSDLEEWDSLAIISVIALIDSQFNITVNSEKLKSCVTVGDIIDIIKDKIHE